MKLTAENVEEIFNECLLKQGEDVPQCLGKGVLTHAAFNSLRLEARRVEIKDMLLQLPDEFYQSRGGGHSFLQAYVTREGNQWGEHVNIDQLLSLGLAAGLVTFTLPREMWNRFHGGMPYFSIAA